MFKVTGVFITPRRGRVYYTSDMKKFNAGRGFDPHYSAKINGHYLFYDSDSDGSYETIFSLASEADTNDGYRVVSSLQKFKLF